MSGRGIQTNTQNPGPGQIPRLGFTTFARDDNTSVISSAVPNGHEVEKSKLNGESVLGIGRAGGKNSEKTVDSVGR